MKAVLRSRPAVRHAARGLVLGAAGLAAVGLWLGAARGEWTHRYPRITGFAHQIYVEGYELPFVHAGPADAAVRPDGRALAVAAGGHVYLVALGADGVQVTATRRLTGGPHSYSRPAWSPDGKALALVRDSGTDTALYALEVATGKLEPLVETPALELDPAYSADGKAVLFSSSAAGDLDLWRLDLATRQGTRLTQDVGLELRPLPLPDGRRVLFVSKQRSGADTLSLLDTVTGQRSVLLRLSIASQLRPALSADGRRVLLNLPDPGALDETLRLSVFELDAEKASLSVEVPVLLPGGQRPLAPALWPDGSAALYSAPDAAHRLHLWRVPTAGGTPIEITPQLAEPASARLTVRTVLDGVEVPARLSLRGPDGHPLIPDTGITRVDGQSGMPFVYSPGRLTVPVLLEGQAGPGRGAAPVSIRAARGLFKQARAELALAAGESREVTLDLGQQPGWDAAAAGYVSGDHHLHLNYGGPYAATVEDLALIARAEDLDVATPMAANLHNRISDLGVWQRLGPGAHAVAPPAARPVILFSQEVRSHFLGHVGLVGIPAPYWPFYFGPGYPARAQEDRSNAEALAWARRHGGVGSYVHPVAVRDPFARDAPRTAVPLSLVVDALLGDLDTIEVACLWTDELGTAALWYPLLNLGLPIAPSAGTDAMVNVPRNMAVGTTRLYVRTGPPAAPGPSREAAAKAPAVAAGTTGDRFELAAYLAAVRAGRGFVTNGPALLLTVEEAGEKGPGALYQPGEVIPGRGGTGSRVRVQVRGFSLVPLDKLELVVNGQVAADAGPQPAGAFTYRTELALPSGGWLAARAHGGVTTWPSMDSYPFAHTGPLWLGKVGSVEPQAERAAAERLLGLFALLRQRLDEGYPPDRVSALQLRQRFQRAEALLRERLSRRR
ncbi:MAG: CehA/McbA family metallohydrolase [Polyangia bacterium]